MSAGPGQWLAVAIGILIGAMAVRLAPQYWRHEITVLDRSAPSWWPYGAALWRAWIRTSAISGAWLLSASIGYLLLLVGPDPGWPPFLAIAYRTLAVGVPLVLLAAAFTVMLFSWPRFLIPPYLRSQPGAVSQWISTVRDRPRHAGRDEAG